MCPPFAWCLKRHSAAVETAVGGIRGESGSLKQNIGFRETFELFPFDGPDGNVMRRFRLLKSKKRTTRFAWPRYESVPPHAFLKHHRRPACLEGKKAIPVVLLCPIWNGYFCDVEENMFLKADNALYIRYPFVLGIDRDDGMCCGNRITCTYLGA